MFNTSSISGHITLESAGLVALADLSTVAGCINSNPPTRLIAGNFQTGSLTSGHVFRVENPATVSYLQSISRTGYLVTAPVEPKPNLRYSLTIPYFGDIDLSPPNRPFYVAGVFAALLYLLCPLLTIIVFALVGSIKDWWALGVLGMLVLSRTINVVFIKRRVADEKDWKGADEKPDADGDLVVVLSQDRWIRLRGKLPGVKRVTAGQWLRDEDRVESLAVGIATLLVYAAAALAGNALTIGSLLIALLLLFSVALLALCNSFTHCLQMYDCVVRKEKGEGSQRHFKRRLDMVRALVKEIKEGGRQTGNPGQWAIRMQLIQDDELEDSLKSGSTSATDLSKGPNAAGVSVSAAAVMC